MEKGFKYTVDVSQDGKKLCCKLQSIQTEGGEEKGKPDIELLSFNLGDSNAARVLGSRAKIEIMEIFGIAFE